MTLSKEMDSPFKLYLRNTEHKSTVKDFNVLVLTSGYWPYAKDSTPFNVPQDVCLAL